MKRIFSVLFVVLFFLDSTFAYATTETPTKPPAVNPVETTCPPSYVGQKKCFMINNPRLNYGDIDGGKRIIVQPRKIPTRSNGLPPTAASLVLGYLISQFLDTEYGQLFQDKIDEIDLAAGRAMDNLVSAVADDFQNAYNMASSGFSKILELSPSSVQAFLEATGEALSLTNYASNVQELPDGKYRVYPNPSDKSISYVIPSPGYPLYKVIGSVTNDDGSSWIYLVVVVSRDNGDIEFAGFKVSTLGGVLSWPGGWFSPEQYDFLVDSLLSKLQEDMNLNGVQQYINRFDFSSLPIFPNDHSVHVPYLPNVINDETKVPPIVEIGDEKYWEVDDGGKTTYVDVNEPTKVVPEKTIVTEDGHEVQEDGSISTEPVIDPSTLPKEGTDTDTDTDPDTDPDTDLDTGTPTNPFAIPVDAIGALLCILKAVCLYLIRLFNFIISIPNAPQIPFGNSAFEWFKSVRIMGVQIYNVVSSLASVGLSVMVYKAIRKVLP